MKLTAEERKLEERRLVENGDMENTIDLFGGLLFFFLLLMSFTRIPRICILVANIVQEWDKFIEVILAQCILVLRCVSYALTRGTSYFLQQAL